MITLYTLFGVFTVFWWLFYIFSDLKDYQKYRQEYKNHVIDKVVGEICDDCQYIADGGMSLSQYKKGFSGKEKKLNSEDKIICTLKDGLVVEMSQVKATHEEKRTGSKGETYSDVVVDFEGLFGIAKLSAKAENSFWVLTQDTKNRYQKNRIELESQEFERLYDVYAEDGVYALKIFSPSLIEEFININKQGCKGLELKIEGDECYFRYKSGDVLEPPKKGDAISKETIRDFYLSVFNPIYMLKIINKAILENRNI